MLAGALKWPRMVRMLEAVAFKWPQMAATLMVALGWLQMVAMLAMGRTIDFVE